MFHLKSSIKGGLVAAGLVIAASGAMADAVSDAIAKADRQAPREALATLEAAQKAAPGRADLLAELSLSWSDVADLEEGNKKAARQAAQKAQDLAQAAVARNGQLARGHLALAVAYGKMTDFVDNSTKMQLSREIRDEALKTIELDKNQYLAYEILGRWEYGIATLNPILKVAARVAYGALPEASLPEAARHLEKAVALAPKQIGPQEALAQVYEKMGKKAKARAAWEKVLALPATDAGDRAAQKEARSALKR